MKNLFFFLLFIPIVCLGQGKHMKFRNVEINGNILIFAGELQKLDYTISSIENQGSTIRMKGKFIERDCELFILASTKTKVTWKVAVYFGKATNWRSLKSDYVSLKEQINEKYGKPFKSSEFFANPNYEGDGRELQSLRKGKCTYFTYWKTDEGFVKLSITSFCQISIGYEDKLNSEIDSKEGSRVQKDL